MVSTYKIGPEDLAFFEEFRKTPIGHHSPGLQRVLTVFRGEALEGKYFLLCVEPHRKWVLAQSTGERGAPLKLLERYVFTDREEAERKVFKLRWARHTGEPLEREGEPRDNPPLGPLPKLQICGYGDKLSGRPGDRIRFMVNCEGPESYRADVVRLRCGDDNPDGPGFKETPVETPIDGVYPGRRQSIAAGSSAVVGGCGALGTLESFTLQAMIWPTTPEKGEQGLVGWWSEAGAAGFVLMIDERGCLAMRWADAEGCTATIATGLPLRRRAWYLAGARYDASDRRLRVIQQALAEPQGEPRSGIGEAVVAPCKFPPLDSPLVMAGVCRGRVDGRHSVDRHFNGKIDGPRLVSRALEPEDMEAFQRLARPEEAPDLVAAWDFAQDIPSVRIRDRSANALHGELVNLPTRGVTGWSWTGEEMDWKSDPGQWGAIHFHDDDLYDAGWEADFELEIPDLESGVYAARLRGDGAEDYVPFVVGPRPGREKRLAVLWPTATYMAYGNEHIATDYEDTELGCGKLSMLYPQDVFLNEHREYGASLYDTHSDGSGVCYASRLRPILNMRPKYEAVYGAYGGSQLWGFNADLHIIDWLEAMRHDYDVVTDEELHAEGPALLAPYRAVITGSHPEYFSRPMLDAIEDYTRRGGRLLYLGGNGFYWRIAFHSELPGVMEVRRCENGVRAWASEPGESYHSFDGAYGGTWRLQGRAPNQLVGVGFVAQGGNLSSYFRRLPNSFDPKVTFIFDGVGAKEPIGDFGLVGGGAAGLEIDRSSEELGTPPWTYLLASSQGHTDNYLVTLEDTLQPGPGRGGREHPFVRADMVFLETGAGGAVFSASSITWAGSLSHNGYRNNVSQITENVLERFLDPAPF